MSESLHEPLLGALELGAGAVAGVALSKGMRRDPAASDAKHTHAYARRAFMAATTAFGVALQAYDLFGDYYLAFTVYLAFGDRLYFGWSLTFSLLTVLGFWYMGWRGRSIFSESGGNAEGKPFIEDDDESLGARVGRVALRVPVLASLAVPVYAPSTAMWALVCGTFPQYIINISHALETRDLGTATLVSLSGSLLMLVLAPIHMLFEAHVGQLAVALVNRTHPSNGES